MSERGVFAIDRGVFDHDCFADEAFTEREAWVWLIAEAAWKDRTRRVGSYVVNLRRGQVVASVRFMADKWQWSKSAVDRYLSKLKKRDMIGTEDGTGINVITICKYDEYQRVSLPNEPPSGTLAGTAAGQQRDKTEGIEDIKEKDSRTVARATRPDGPAFEEFKKLYPKRKGANPWTPARSLFDAAIKSGVSADQMFAALRAGVGFDRDKIGTEFVPRAMQWLKERRYLDHTPPSAAAFVQQGNYVAPDTPQMDAWLLHEREAGKRYPRDRNGGWHFPSEWPPGHQSAA